MKVDNSTNGANDPTFGRPSIKIMSNATVPAGSLVLMDAVHMPFGVSSEFLPLVRPPSSFVFESVLYGLHSGCKAQTGQTTVKSTLLKTSTLLPTIVTLFTLSMDAHILRQMHLLASRRELWNPLTVSMQRTETRAASSRTRQPTRTARASLRMGEACLPCCGMTQASRFGSSIGPAFPRTSRRPAPTLARGQRRLRFGRHRVVTRHSFSAPRLSSS